MERNVLCSKYLGLVGLVFVVLTLIKEVFVKRSPIIFLLTFLTLIVMPSATAIDLTIGLSSFWSFDGTQTKTNTSEFDWTNSGVTSIAGKIQDGGNFDGVADELSSSNATNVGASWCINMWTKPTTSGVFKRVVDKFDAATGWEMQYRDTTKFRMLYQQPAQLFLETNKSIGVGEFHMLTFTRDDSTDNLSWYVNGTLDASVIDSGTWLNSTVTYFMGGSGSNYNGVIDLVSFYLDTSCTPEMVTAHFNNGDGLNFDGLAGVGAPEFSSVVNNATELSTTGTDVNWTTTISSGTELSFCWFTHNDSGTFVNETVQSCTTPFIFDQEITITANPLEQVCGFFGANATDNAHAQSAQSCFIVADVVGPTFVNATNNATSTDVNNVVQWLINMSDDQSLATFTFGFNSSGSFVNDSTVQITGTNILVAVNKSVLTTPNLFICGRFYFNDTFNNENQSESCYTTPDLILSNITAFNAITNNSVTAFSATITGITNTSFSRFLSTGSSLITTSLVSGNYSVNTSAALFSQGFANFTVGAGEANSANVSMFPDPSSISLRIIRESDQSLLLQLVTINVLGSLSDVNFSTIIGSVFMGGLQEGILEVIVASEGFSTRNYFVTLGLADHTNLTARLLNSTGAGVQDVTFTIRNNANEILSDVTMTVARRLNATFLPIGQDKTDISGQVIFTLDSAIEYEITLAAATFNTRIFRLTPTQTTYTIFLQPVATLNFTSIFNVVSYLTSPFGTILTGNDTEFVFTVNSPTGAINFFSLNISVGSLSNFTTITGSPAGGTITMFLNLSGLEGQTVTGIYIINAVGFPTFTLNRTFSVQSFIQPGNQTLLRITERAAADLTPPMRIILVTIISAVLALAMVPFAGPLGAAMMAMTVQIFFTFIGWIPIWQMSLIGMVMISMWLFLGRRGEV